MTSTSHQTIDRLRERFEGGFVPSGFRGTANFNLEGPTATRLSIELSDSGIGFSTPAESANVDIVIRPGLAQQIIETPETIDFRSPLVVTQLHIHGDDKLGFHLLRMLLRPSAHTVAVFAQADSRKYPDLGRVERLCRPSEVELERRLAAGLPTIVTGALTHWLRAAPSWTALRERYGHIPLRARSNGELQTLGEFLDDVDTAPSGQKVYTNGCPLPRELREVFAPAYFRDRDLSVAQIWLGARTDDSPATQLHRDPMHGMLGQVLGSKRVLIYPPDQKRHLEPTVAYNFYQPCRGRPWEPHHPSAAARGIDLTLLPGELMVLPAGLFHCVFNESPVLSVSSFVELRLDEDAPDTKRSPQADSGMWEGTL